MRTVVMISALAAVALAAAACAAAGRPASVSSVQARTVQSTSQCPFISPAEATRFEIFDDGAQWSTHLRGKPSDVLQREVRWADERVLLFSIGRQPTLGIGVAPISNRLAVNGGTLDLRVKVTRPGPDQMVGQALTWPCVLVVVPRQGWDTAVVTDEQGNKLTDPVLAR